MASITTRAGKGSPLTNAELDANFNNINAQLSTAVITGGTIDGATIGATTATTGKFSQLDVDNLRLDGNTISSTDTNGNVTIAPNGTGIATFSKATVVETTDNTNAALRITQLGTGNALLVEDSTNPDATPIVINATGTLINGHTTSVTGYNGRGVPQQVIGGGGQLNAVYSTSTTNGGTYEGARSRSTTLGVHEVVQSNDWLGHWVASGSDGTQFIRAAAIVGAVDGTPGTDDMPGRLMFFTTADGASTPTERMRIDSSGNVGIGTSSPQNVLHVAAADATLRLTTTSDTGEAGIELWDNQSGTSQAAAIRYEDTTNTFTIQGNSNGTIFLTPSNTFPSASEAMRITSAGNVGIGTSSPGYRLDVAQNSAANNFIGRFLNTDTGSGSGAALLVTQGAVTAQLQAYGNNTVFFGSQTNHPVVFQTNSAERMRIDSSGNVGIGTSSPGEKLDVNGTIVTRASGGEGGEVRVNNPDNASVGLTMDVSTADTARIFQGRNNSVMQIGQLVGTGGIVTFSTAAAERARIDSSGQLLIGVTSLPSAGSGGTGFRVDSNGRRNLYLSSTSTATNDLITFQNPNGNVGNITTNGSSTAYNTSSDYRLKHDIQPMTGALAKVVALKPCTYKWKSDGTDGQGFIAHELDEVVSGCVTGEKDAVEEQQYEVTPAVKDEEGNTVTEAVMGTRTVPVYQGIDTSFLVATLTAAIQELHALVKTQDSTITALTTRITALESI